MKKFVIVIEYMYIKENVEKYYVIEIKNLRIVQTFDKLQSRSSQRSKDREIKNVRD